ncbi:MAG: PilZ domain-containing protein [Planctomycetaceae bacterium]
MNTATAPQSSRDICFPALRRTEAPLEVAKLSAAFGSRPVQPAGRTPRASRLSQVLRALASRSGVAAGGEIGHELTVAPSLDHAAPPVAAAAQPRSVLRVPPSAEDRRRFLRRPSTHLVRILPFRDVAVSEVDLEWELHESPLRGQMSNISMNGVAFRLSQPMAVSSRVWLKLESRTRDFAVVRSARIVRATPISDPQWTLTCRFDHCVPYADVVQLGQELG